MISFPVHNYSHKSGKIEQKTQNVGSEETTAASLSQHDVGVVGTGDSAHTV